MGADMTPDDRQLLDEIDQRLRRLEEWVQAIAKAVGAPEPKSEGGWVYSA